MSGINRSQKFLLSAEYLFDINPLKKYQVLFDHLDTSPLNDRPSGPGRHAVSKPALLRALIYKCLKPLPTLLADSVYDSEDILSFVIDELKAKPRIPRNYRAGSCWPPKLSRCGNPICIAGFEMIYWGKFKDRGKVRKKFCCPITHSKRFAKEHPTCPWNHPAFIKGRGCNTYLRGDRDIRKTIDYGSGLFKEQYNMRTGSERLASRLLTVCMQDPSVRGLSATANHCTIAHITVLLVAITAAKSGHSDKIRFIKNFLPSL
jgi:hypothetical protein